MSQADSFHIIGMEEKKDYYAALASNMYSILSFIDTLEVKEVDDRPECKIFPRPIECYSNCKECPWLAINNKAQKGEEV